MKAMYRVSNEHEEGQETSDLTWAVCVPSSWNNTRMEEENLYRENPERTMEENAAKKWHQPNNRGGCLHGDRQAGEGKWGAEIQKPQFGH